MIEKLTYIELADGSYPIKCDLAVLEAAQEEYGKLTEFENRLSGAVPTGETDEQGRKLYRQGEPSMKAVRFALPLMINEGIDIENHLKRGKRKHVTEMELAERLVCVNVFEIADRLHEEFAACFASKNPKSTQEEEKKSR